MPTTRVVFLVCLVLLVGVSVEARAQTFTLLYTFGNVSGDPGAIQYPGTITQGRDGNLYTTSPAGGIGDGAVFKFTPLGKLTLLYEFDILTGFEPLGGLTLGADGNFYGTAYAGGAGDSDGGTVFKITPTGVLTDLYNFRRGNDGALPYGAPIQATNGYFYGTTSTAEATGGTVYRITPAGTLTTIYGFDGTSGASPFDPLIQAADGNFYGTTVHGGANGFGAVFKITPRGKITTLYSFDGAFAYPYAPLTQGTDGNFYGTVPLYGGAIFRMTPSGEVSFLYTFSGGADGCFPYSSVIEATDGNLYGVASGCGAFGYGTIYKISPAGSFSVVYSFDNATGASPSASLVQHTNGMLYGNASAGGLGLNCSRIGCGTFFRLDVGLGAFIRLVSTSGGAGKRIGILGQGFKGTTAVSFNGTPASFKVWSGTFLTTTVPVGATNGAVTVTTPTGRLVSNQTFQVTNIQP